MARDRIRRLRLCHVVLNRFDEAAPAAIASPLMRKIVDTILPTTMVGSYPRPHWYTYQLLGRDVRVAFKHVDHAEAYEDATQVVINDQEEAGLDIVTDGQMSYDDYVGVIGSFCWYMYERIPGFDAAKEEHPAALGQDHLGVGL